MSGNGQLLESDILRWPSRVVAVEELRRTLNGHRELSLAAGTIITPLAADDLKARGIRIRHHAEAKPTRSSTTWAVGQEWPEPLVHSAVQALERDGISLLQWPHCRDGADCAWAKEIAQCVARGDCRGGVIFCRDANLACCIANKVAGLRAAAVTTVGQAARATLTLGTNLLAVEMPGRTYFEARQILRILCQPAAPACPERIAFALRELDGHAHR